MGKIILREAPKPWNASTQIERRGPAHVLGLGGAPTGSASARGSTYWKRLMRCPQEHAFHELVQLRGKYDDEALTAGFLYHHALEAYYGTHQNAQYELTDVELRGPDIWCGQSRAEAAAWASIAPVRNEPGYDVAFSSTIPSTWETVEKLLAGYFDRYRREERFRVISTEETLHYTDPKTGLDYSARLDLIVECLERGGMWIVEHKSARSITTDLLEGYQLDLQILGQFWLMRKCVDLAGLPPLKGVIVNIGTKQKTPRFDRVVVCPSDQHLIAFERAMETWTTVADVYGQLGYPRAFGKCIGPDRGYRRCSYFDLCHAYPLRGTDEWLVEPDPPDGFLKIDNDTSALLESVEDGEG